MAERRKDSKNRVLKANEYERKDGMYEYKWRDRRGKRYSVYCATLEGLREKEAEITLNKFRIVFRSVYSREVKYEIRFFTCGLQFFLRGINIVKI